MIACMNDDTDMCQVLITHGACVNMTNGTVLENTTLYYTAVNGSCNIVACLLENGVQIYDPSKLRVNSPTEAAVMQNDHCVISVLLDHCNKTECMIPLRSAFDMTIKRLKEECAVTFLQSRYHPFHRAPFAGMCKTSCFHVAAEKGLVKLMSMLVELNPYFMQEK